MTLSQLQGIWLPFGRGVLIHSINVGKGRVISTKSRCPCVVDFAVVSQTNQSSQIHQSTTLDLISEFNKLATSKKEITDQNDGEQSIFQKAWKYLSSFLFGEEAEGQQKQKVEIKTETETETETETLILVQPPSINQLKKEVGQELAKTPCCSTYQLIIKTRDSIRQEEMASHIINEVNVDCFSTMFRFD